MQCLVLLGVVASVYGDVRRMRALSNEAVASPSDHGWERSPWSVTATAMLAYTALLRAEPAEPSASPPTGSPSARPLSPPLRFALQAVHGAAIFDRGHRAHGLAELQQARSELGDLPPAREQLAPPPTLGVPRRAAARPRRRGPHRPGLAGRPHRRPRRSSSSCAPGRTAGGRPEHARDLIRPVLDGIGKPYCSPIPSVEAWLLETSIAIAAGERPAARRALQNGFALAEPLDALRPFVQAGPGVRELLVHQHGSFGAYRRLRGPRPRRRAGPRKPNTALLSERELTVLGLLPSMLSLDEIAADLTVSVNTVKSHVRSIYTKLGVSSRRARRARRPRTRPPRRAR